MFRQFIKYEGFDGEPHEWEAYFHYSKADKARIKVRHGDYEDFLANNLRTRNSDVILAELEHMVKTAYGLKSKDGLTFRRSPEILADFVDSGAYDELIYQIATDEKFQIKFIENLLGVDLSKTDADTDASSAAE